MPPTHTHLPFSTAIQVAKLAGFHPIITTASLHNAELLKSLGATHVLDRHLPSDAVLAKLRELTGGKPLEFAFDAVSLPETQLVAYQALAPSGALAVALPDAIPAEVKKEGDGKRVVYVVGNVHVPPNRATGAELFKRLTEWLETGAIKVRFLSWLCSYVVSLTGRVFLRTCQPNPVEVLPNGLAAAPDGLERLEKNLVSGKKLIVRPQETPL